MVYSLSLSLSLSHSLSLALSLSRSLSHFLPLGLSKTTKVHSVIAHVLPFCKEHGKGLGYFSEQCFERLHSRFGEYSKYRLPDVTTTHEYAKALHKVVTEFNVLRIA